MPARDSAHLRAIAAAISDAGMRCDYCGVPTAATIEHVHPQAKGGDWQMSNLVLACNYCNLRKSTMDVDEFRRSGRWKLEHPPLPSTVPEMLSQHFGWNSSMTHLRTGSPHSRLRIYKDNVLLEVRAGKRYEWRTFNLGSPSSRKVVSAAYDFLRRHQTPSEPRLSKNLRRQYAIEANRKRKSKVQCP